MSNGISQSKPSLYMALDHANLLTIHAGNPVLLIGGLSLNSVATLFVCWPRRLASPY
jgi:hypothetical protein